MDGAAQRPLVWIVDDDRDVREIVEELLRASGFDAIAYADGAAAWSALVNGAAPNAIIIDNHMPLMSGVEFRRRQLANPDVADIPVIIYTASGPLVVPGALVVSKAANAEVLIAVLRKACFDRARSA